MVWVIYVSTCDVFEYDLSYCILYNIFILVTKGIFCFFLYPETIHQQAVILGGDRSVQYSEGHYDFYYPLCHFIYVLMCLVFFSTPSCFCSFFCTCWFTLKSRDIPLKKQACKVPSLLSSCRFYNVGKNGKPTLS